MVEAFESGVRLATGLGVFGPQPVETVELNGRTTVATAFCFHQLFDAPVIGGNRLGVVNEGRVFRNLVDPETGQIATMLSESPNGSRRLP